MTQANKNFIMIAVVVVAIIIGTAYVISCQPARYKNYRSLQRPMMIGRFASSSIPVQENLSATTVPSTPTSLANPASMNCEKQGGKLQIETRPDGGQYGLCYFEDNRACEEWALMRGECPIGGRKTTGFDTEAQKFCAWSGGDTLAVPNAVCKFNDGSSCPDEAFYAGTCQRGLKK